MPKRASGATSQKRGWPREVHLGRVTVSIYRRRTSSGGIGYQVANYIEGKRRFDSYPTEAKAMEAARQIARRLSEGDVLAASMSNADAAAYAAAMQVLRPHNVTLPAAADTLAKCLEIVGDLPNLHAAVKFYTARNRRVTRKRVAEVVAELLAVKESRQAKPRYLHDLHSRLGRISAAFQKDCCDVTTAEIQHWLDNLKLSTQSYTNFRRVAHVLFQFAVARGYAADNPVKGTEAIKVRNGETFIFTPAEIRRLLNAAPPDFLPCLAIGAFAGVRTDEIQRLEWSDVRLDARHIVLGREKSKVASRRIVPICDTLAAWLAPYAAQVGPIWPAAEKTLRIRRAETARNAGVRWKRNALRHSYASYRFAQTGDAGRVAGELGNTAQIVHKHYRELVTPADADKWFAVKPEGDTANIVPIAAPVS